MGGNITYMGTKRVLASAVADVVQRAQSGALLDAFSGMCAVGESVGPVRQIWSNDAQVFAASVARAVFTSRDIPQSPVTCAKIHAPHFAEQKVRLRESFDASIDVENELLAASSFEEFSRTLELLVAVQRRDAHNCALRSPHLFSKIYAANFFGVSQAIEIDAIIAAIKLAKARRQSTPDEVRWAFVALGRTLLKTANSTGHFAQYLKPKATNYKRYIALRRRPIWDEWLNSIALVSPVGSAQWRKENRAFNSDSLNLLPRLIRQKADVGVIYADPPYTDDQYSRFYHLLETMCLYDYPMVTGAGLYRSERFQTPFSLISKAPAALERLIYYSSRAGADLILSYPANGLVRQAGYSINQMLKKHFRKVETCFSLAHKHSTFGASKGAAQQSATEHLYLAKS